MTDLPFLHRGFSPEINAHGSLKEVPIQGCAPISVSIPAVKGTTPMLSENVKKTEAKPPT